MATNSGGWLYEATGTPVDKATADNAQARVLEIKGDASAAKGDAAKALQTANAYAGQIAQANTTAGEAKGIAQGAVADVDEIKGPIDTRLTAVEVAAGYAPGDATDAAMTNIATQETTQFRAALNAQIDQSTTPVIESVDTLMRQRIPGTIEIPAGLGVTIPISIIRTRDGILTNIDLEARHTPAVGPTYYVDPVGGSDTNDGLTEATAFKTPNYASRKNVGDWAEIVFTRSGFWDRTNGPFNLKKGCTVRSLPGVTASIIFGDILTGWVANGSAWSVAVASCNNVFDTEYLDPYGDPTPLRLVGSVTEVQATPGTYHFASGTVYVHTADSRQPDSELYVGRPGTSIGWDYAATTGPDASAYVEGVQWWGGNTAANLTANDNGWRFYAKRCGWNAAGTGNGLAAWGLAETILVDCSSNHNYLDGFNYSENAGRTGQFIEINCRARNNGAAGGSNNGSTSHGTYKGIRVGGDYVENQGANVADVNNTRTLNVGCTAAGSTDYRIDYYTNGTSQMWLDGCLAVSDNSITAIDTSAIRVRATAAAGAVTGNVTTY